MYGRFQYKINCKKNLLLHQECMTEQETKSKKSFTCRKPSALSCIPTSRPPTEDPIRGYVLTANTEVTGQAGPCRGHTTR